MSRSHYLFSQWFKRDLFGRYRDSWLGMSWPLLQPLAQVAVFTVILHGFMKIKWPESSSGIVATASAPEQGTLVFALNVLAGLSVFNFFAEVMSRSPSAVLSNPNLVTKVKFPLTLLPLVTTSVAMVHIFVGVLALLVTSLWMGQLSIHWLWLPIWLLPVITYGIALSLFLSAVGVYVRDIGQATPALISLLMFLTPIFYPSSSIPESLQALFSVNPIGWAADALRSILIEKKHLDLAPWSVHFASAVALACLSNWVFRKLRRGFADVL